MNKIVCYTCITGGYDRLKEPLVVSKGIDYICFTDNPFLKSKVWQARPIPKELDYLSNVKKQRIVKICPHRYLKEYDISIWVDGSFQIIGDLMKFIEQYDLEKTSLYTRIHPIRDCIYDEAEACVRLSKDIKSNIQRQIDAYRKEEYPKHIGMAETGIILRKHNDKKCILLDNLWASQLLKYSHRDQLSFNYACWKMHFVYGALNKQFYIQNQFFKIHLHG